MSELKRVCDHDGHISGGWEQYWVKVNPDWEKPMQPEFFLVPKESWPTCPHCPEAKTEPASKPDEKSPACEHEEYNKWAKYYKNGPFHYLVYIYKKDSIVCSFCNTQSSSGKNE